MSTVLIVEDNDLFSSVLSNMLKHENYGAIVAKTICEAKDLLTSNESISLILLDIWIEGSVSFPLIDFVKQHSPSTALFVMSGGGGNLSLEVASSIAEMKGISGFVQKPISRPALVEIVKLGLSEQ